uniref:Uncharacterized protein n=1 Tax=Triticum urartu TaxID=4572 RepID=A0A8R7P4I5_TRIUA
MVFARSLYPRAWVFSLIHCSPVFSFIIYGEATESLSQGCFRKHLLLRVRILCKTPSCLMTLRKMVLIAVGLTL